MPAVPSASTIQTAQVRRKASKAAPDLPDPAWKERARSLDRFRVALRFSLWTWALYWPGGGLLLIYGGLDPISIAVTLSSLASFLLLLRSGALKADASRTMKEFFLERPLYLVAALVVFIAVAAFMPSLEAFVLLLFAASWFGGLALAGTRLVQHVQEHRLGFWRSKADQLLIVFAMAGFFSLLVFLDALLPILNDGDTLDSPSSLVAVSTWANLLYPAFVLLASRPFREPLKWRLGTRGSDPEPDSAEAVSKAKHQPFRAS